MSMHADTTIQGNAGALPVVAGNCFSAWLSGADPRLLSNNDDHGYCHTVSKVGRSWPALVDMQCPAQDDSAQCLPGACGHGKHAATHILAYYVTDLCIEVLTTLEKLPAHLWSPSTSAMIVTTMPPKA
jgi:hypothetical protein